MNGHMDTNIQSYTRQMTTPNWHLRARDVKCGLLLVENTVRELCLASLTLLQLGISSHICRFKFIFPRPTFPQHAQERIPSGK